MGRVVVIPLPEDGHLNSSRGLVRALRRRGHEVIHVGPEESHAAYGVRGFTLVGAATAAQARRARWKSDRTLALLRMFEMERVAVPAVVERLAPDLTLIDSCLPSTIFACLARGLRVAMLTSTVSVVRDSFVPPFKSSVALGRGVASRLQARAAWLRSDLRNTAIEARWDAFLRLQGRGELSSRSLRSAAGLDRAAIVLDSAGAHARTMTEVVCCPQAFDAMHPADEHRIYVGCTIDLPAESGDLPAESGDLPPASGAGERERLTICALGTQNDDPKSLPHRTRFFGAVVDAYAQMPDEKLILATHDAKLRATLDGRSPNVSVVERFAQVELLTRARLMITHGGLNSVKECIRCGVPMVVYPCREDQFGNAERVRWHGLGVVGDLRAATADSVRRTCEYLLDGRSTRSRVDAMSARFLRDHEDEAGVDALEALIQSR